MFCRNCGENVADGVKFCPKCGNPTGVQPQEAAGQVLPQPEAQASQAQPQPEVQTGQAQSQGQPYAAQPQQSAGAYQPQANRPTWQPIPPIKPIPPKPVLNTMINKILAIVAAVLALVSPFLPGLTASAFGMSETGSLVEIYAEEEGGLAVLFIPLVIGILIFLILQFVGKPKLSAIGAFIMTAWVIFFVIIIKIAVDQYAGYGVSTHFSIGVYLWFVSLIVAWVAAFFPPKKAAE